MIYNNYGVIAAQSVKDLPDNYPLHFDLLPMASLRFDTFSTKLIIPRE
jgi:hypothetical protein